jgi:hypothetical protein
MADIVAKVFLQSGLLSGATFSVGSREASGSETARVHHLVSGASIAHELR